MANKKVADLVVDVLVEAGVERIYGVAGDSLNGITDTIRAGERLKQNQYEGHLKGLARPLPQSSAGRPEPPVAGCRLKTMARSSKRMCGRQAHRIGHQEHGIRSASRSIVSSIQVDSGQSCSIRPET